MEAKAPPMLKAQGVKRYFQGVKAVDGVDLQLESGTVLGLIGPNGAGKTTFFNVVTRLLPTTAGTIWFDGREITRWRPDQATAAGMARTFQNIRLFKDFSVLDNVLVGMYTRVNYGLGTAFVNLRERRAKETEARRVARQLLERVGLEGREGERATELAYGDQRRVEVARALASKPKLLLLDEPTAGMNRREAEQFGDLVLEMKRSGLTILMIAHDIPLVMNFCDRVAVLSFGRKIAEGPPEEVKRLPQVIKAYLGEEAMN